MARIAERERVQARRRALIGAVMLVSAAGLVLAPSVSWVASWVAMFAHTEAVSPIATTFATLWGAWTSLLEGLWIAFTVIAQNVGEIPLVVYACVVLAMTAVWVQIVSGSFQHLFTLQPGGYK